MPETSPPTVVVLIDAFRCDYLCETRAPLLTSFAGDLTSQPMRPPLAYSDGIRAALFTGRHADETGYWMEYCYRPDTSPWHGFGRLSPVDRVPSDLLLRAGKLAASKSVLPLIAKRRKVLSLDLRTAPLRAIDRFDFTLDRPMTQPGAFKYETIFDRCTATNRPWLYLDSTKMRPEQMNAAVTSSPSDVGLIFIYLHQIDMASHLFGLDSPRLSRTIADVDRHAFHLLRTVRRRFGDPSIFVLSDHGMTQLRVQRGIPELPLHPGFPSKFFAALDATMIRLWYLSDSPALRRELRERIQLRFPGRFLSPEDRATYHVAFDNNLYGEDFFLLDPGFGVFPNYHSFIKPKAMHAYEPTDPDQLGIYIGPESLTPVDQPIEITDIAGLVFRSIETSSRSPR